MATNRTPGSNSNTDSSSSNTSRSTGRQRGFAAMSPDEQRDIARRGGQAVSRDRAHMSEIGRQGAAVRHGSARQDRSR